MHLEEKTKPSKVSEFSILPYTQNRKLRNLGKCSFTWNFDSCFNLRFRNNKNELRQKKLMVIKWIKKKKMFRFCPITKTENLEISENVTLQILTVVVTFSKFAFSTESEWNLVFFIFIYILRHIFPENLIKTCVRYFLSNFYFFIKW